MSAVTRSSDASPRSPRPLVAIATLAIGREVVFRVARLRRPEETARSGRSLTDASLTTRSRRARADQGPISHPTLVDGGSVPVRGSLAPPRSRQRRRSAPLSQSPSEPGALIEAVRERRIGRTSLDQLPRVARIARRRSLHLCSPVPPRVGVLHRPRAIASQRRVQAQSALRATRVRQRAR